METNTVFEAGALTGRQQAFAMIASQCTYAQAVCLKEIHDTRAYETLGLTWEDFCSQHAGISRVTAETIIRRLDALAGHAVRKWTEVAEMLAVPGDPAR